MASAPDSHGQPAVVDGASTPPGRASRRCTRSAVGVSAAAELPLVEVELLPSRRQHVRPPRRGAHLHRAPAHAKAARAWLDRGIGAQRLLTAARRGHRLREGRETAGGDPHAAPPPGGRPWARCPPAASPRPATTEPLDGRGPSSAEWATSCSPRTSAWLGAASWTAARKTFVEAGSFAGTPTTVQTRRAWTDALARAAGDGGHLVRGTCWPSAAWRSTARRLSAPRPTGPPRTVHQRLDLLSRRAAAARDLPACRAWPDGGPPAPPQDPWSTDVP
ncbi:hypothetical protein QJS66_18565 [Kocuria rhizophila]|nr:hypothetical protein QJS66_18565 [Kocuria rhizophila]